MWSCESTACTFPHGLLELVSELGAQVVRRVDRPAHARVERDGARWPPNAQTVDTRVPKAGRELALAARQVGLQLWEQPLQVRRMRLGAGGQRGGGESAPRRSHGGERARAGLLYAPGAGNHEVGRGRRQIALERSAPALNGTQRIPQPHAP